MGVFGQPLPAVVARSGGESMTLANEPDRHAARGFIAWANSLPMAKTFGVRCVDAARGHTTFTIETAPFTPNPNGAVHGGILAAIVDHIMGVTALSVLPPMHAAVTATLTINFLAPAEVPLTLHTRLTRQTRSLLFLESQASSGDREVDRAFGTFVPRADYLLDRREAPPGTSAHVLEHPVIGTDSPPA